MSSPPFAKKGCGRFAVALGGAVAFLPKTLANFEAHVVKAARGDVDVFMYATLAEPLHSATAAAAAAAAGGGGPRNRPSSSSSPRKEQVALLATLHASKPWLVAAVVEHFHNASAKQAVLDACLRSDSLNAGVDEAAKNLGASSPPVFVLVPLLALLLVCLACFFRVRSSCSRRMSCSWIPCGGLAVRSGVSLACFAPPPSTLP